MKRVYADNSATSFPKAPGVSDAMKDFIDNTGCNINRGGYKSSYDVAFKVLETRELIANLFHIASPKNVIFTPSVTYSINMLIKGFLKKGDHSVTTSMEHNAVMRPLVALEKMGVAFDRVFCDADGSLDTSKILPLIKPNTKAIIMTHASNVCGTIMPIEEVSQICKRHNIRLIVDAAQTAGIIDIDANLTDALAFTGHKGLLAPQGIGGFIIKDDFVKLVEPLIEGGTGSDSHKETHPNFLPDKFEPGTMNIPGILGLRESIAYIYSYGRKSIEKAELSITEMFLEEVKNIQGVEIVGKKGISGRLAVISLNFPSHDNAEISASLDENYGIMTRCGLHCAPSAHKTLGTYPHGTVRFSFGHFNTVEEITYIVGAIKDLLKAGA